MSELQSIKEQSGSVSKTQCAAVMTIREVRSDPPQICSPSYEDRCLPRVLRDRGGVPAHDFRLYVALALRCRARRDEKR